MNDRVRLAAERILRLYCGGKPADVDALRDDLGLSVIGSTLKGKYKLRKGSLGKILLRHKQIVVDARLLDDFSQESKYREIVAHEVAHFILHSGFLLQESLPIFSHGKAKLRTSLAFRSTLNSPSTEREAIYLSALMLVPVEGLIHAVEDPMRAYYSSSWTSASSRVNELEEQAGEKFQMDAVALISERFAVPTSTAEVVLDFWNATKRPPREWLLFLEGGPQKTNLLT